MSKCSFNKECIKKMKELLANKDWSSNLINVFTTRYLLQAQECTVAKGSLLVFFLKSYPL